MPLNPEQRGEIFLTAAQSAFAVAILIKLSINVPETMALLGLFLLQFLVGGLAQLGALPTLVGTAMTYGVGALYLVLAAVTVVRHLGPLRERVRDGLRAAPQELHEAEREDEPSSAGNRR